MLDFKVITGQGGLPVSNLPWICTVFCICTSRLPLLHSVRWVQNCLRLQMTNVARNHKFDGFQALPVEQAARSHVTINVRSCKCTHATCSKHELCAV